MLHDDQILLIDDGLPGKRLSDAWLLPASLRRIDLTDDRVAITHSLPGLPEPFAWPMGPA
jgi:hypothetical protein